MTLPEELARAQLAQCIAETDLPLPGVRARHRGKVRDSYLLRDGRRVLVCTDRLSAFDVILGTIPWKGQVLNQLAAFWFDLTAQLVPNHVLAVPDPNVMLVRECRPLPAEFVVRAYLTGVTTTSIWHAYAGGARVFCGHRLPEGLKKNEPLPGPLLTPSTKAAGGPGDGAGHDESVAGAELVARGLLSEEELAAAGALCLRLFALGQERARARGLILADSKYELGVAPGGELLVIDEVHTPDSSRYWYAEDYEARLARGEEPRSLDKEYVRRYLAERGYRGDGPPPPLPDEVRIEAARRYVAAFELLTARPFSPDLSPPLPRMERHLKELLR